MARLQLLNLTKDEALGDYRWDAHLTRGFLVEMLRSKQVIARALREQAIAAITHHQGAE